MVNNRLDRQNKSEARQDASELRQHDSEVRQSDSEGRQHSVCLEHSGFIVAMEDAKLIRSEMKEDILEIKVYIKEINQKLERVPVLWEVHSTSRKMIYGAYTAVMVAYAWIFYHLNK